MQEDKKIERLSGDLHGLSAAPDVAIGKKKKKSNVEKKRKHVIYLEDQAEIKNWNAAEHFDTAEELAGRSFNRPHLKDLEEKPAIIGDVTGETLKTLQKKQKRKYEELKERKKSSKKINGMISKLERSKNLQSKGRRAKIVTRDKFGDIDKSKTVYKWKMERKK